MSFNKSSEKELAQHRVIGIRHALKVLKDAQLISEEITHPADAVIEISRRLEELERRANSAEIKTFQAKRFRSARSDCSVPAMINNIGQLFYLPTGSVILVYPSGRKAQSNLTVGHLRSKWYEYFEE